MSDLDLSRLLRKLEAAGLTYSDEYLDAKDEVEFRAQHQAYVDYGDSNEH